MQHGVRQQLTQDKDAVRLFRDIVIARNVETKLARSFGTQRSRADLHAAAVRRFDESIVRQDAAMACTILSIAHNFVDAGRDLDDVDFQVTSDLELADFIVNELTNRFDGHYTNSQIFDGPNVLYLLVNIMPLDHQADLIADIKERLTPLKQFESLNNIIIKPLFNALGNLKNPNRNRARHDAYCALVLKAMKFLDPEEISEKEPQITIDYELDFTPFARVKATEAIHLFLEPHKIGETPQGRAVYAEQIDERRADIILGITQRWLAMGENHQVKYAMGRFKGQRPERTINLTTDKPQNYLFSLLHEDDTLVAVVGESLKKKSAIFIIRPDFIHTQDSWEDIVASPQKRLATGPGRGTRALDHRAWPDMSMPETMLEKIFALLETPDEILFREGRFMSNGNLYVPRSILGAVATNLYQS